MNPIFPSNSCKRTSHLIGEPFVCSFQSTICEKEMQGTYVMQSMSDPLLEQDQGIALQPIPVVPVQVQPVQAQPATNNLEYLMRCLSR